MTYSYGAEGRRVKKTSSLEPAVFYVYAANGELVAEDSGSRLSAAAVRSFVTVDALGSTRLLTDDVGGVKQRRDYQAFGEEVPASATYGKRQLVLDGGVASYNAAGGARMQFTGKERDAETGLDYFGARYMSAALGRFTSPDQCMGLRIPIIWRVCGSR